MAGETKTRSLTDVLREKQIVSEKQLEKALQYRSEHDVTLDQALVHLDILSEEDLRMVYADLFQIRFLKLEDVEIDREAVRHVPAVVARRFHLIPVRRSGNTLAVAMADPTDIEAINALKAVTDFEIIPFVARYDVIEHAVYLHHGEAVDTADESGSSGSPGAYPRNLINDDRIGHVGRSLPFNHGQTFDTFVEDTANQFAVSVARSISALQTEEGFNPFLCWGGAGVGKSHLLNAIAAEITKRAPLKRIILTTGERFVESLFECVRDRKLNFFRYLYREADILLIDDATAILTHDWPQQEFAETIRHLHHHKRFLILSARTNLALEPRVTSEIRVLLESGVIAAIGAYSPAAKYEIARRRVGSVELQPNILKMLADHSATPATLNTVVEHAVVMTMLSEQDVNESVARELLDLYGLVEGNTVQRVRGLYERMTASGKSAENGDDMNPEALKSQVEPRT